MKTYTFIRYDRDPKLPYLFSSYEQTANTQPIQYNGEVVCGLVLNKDTARNVALMQGWQEITEQIEKEGNRDDKDKDTIKEDTTNEGTTVVEKTVKAKPKRKRTTRAKAKK